MDFSLVLFYPAAFALGFLAALIPKGRLRLFRRLIGSALAGVACTLVVFGPYIFSAPLHDLRLALTGILLMVSLGIGGGLVGAAIRWFKGENWEF